MFTEAVQGVRPGAEVQVRIDRSARLTDAVDRGEIGLAVCVAERPPWRAPLRWYAAPAGSRPPPPRVPRTTWITADWCSDRGTAPDGCQASGTYLYPTRRTVTIRCRWAAPSFRRRRAM